MPPPTPLKPTVEPPDPASSEATAVAAHQSEDERRLAEGLWSRSPECVAEFLERSHHAVFCMACRLTADPEMRRDWVHGVLLGILEDFQAGRFVYRRPGSLWAWFRKRAYYRLLDQHRCHRKRAGRERPVEAGEESDRLTSLAGADDPVEEMARLETMQAVEACVAALDNPDHRRALSLRLFEDLSYDEIAAALGAPLNTVRAWIRRGRLVVRRCLALRLGRPGESS